MKKRIDILFYSSIGLIIIGILLRTQDLRGGIFLTIGLSIIFVYYLIRTSKDLFIGVSNKLVFVQQILLSLMAITLFSKYLYHLFWDYPGLLVVPIFIAVSLIYIIKEKQKNRKLTLTTVVFLILTIPLFGFDFHKSPRSLSDFVVSK